MKKRIKTRRLTNIYHSDDDDVGTAIICYPLSLSLSISLSLSLSLPLSRSLSLFPRQLSAVSSQNVLKFLSTMFGFLLLLATAKSGFL